MTSHSKRWTTNGKRSQQLAKPLDRKPRVADDTAHGEGVDRIVARDGNDPSSVGHHHVLALARDAEARLLQGAHGGEVIDAGDFRQGLGRDLDLAHVDALELRVDDRQVFPDRVADVVDGLRLGRALRPAAGQPRHGDAKAFFRTLQCNPVSHGEPRLRPIIQRRVRGKPVVFATPRYGFCSAISPPPTFRRAACASA